MITNVTIVNSAKYTTIVKNQLRPIRCAHVRSLADSPVNRIAASSAIDTTWSSTHNQFPLV